MSNAIYPTIHGLAWTVLKTPSFDTTVRSSSSMTEVRIRNTINPIWKWEFMYEYLYDFFVSPNNAFAAETDLRTLMGFYMARGGQFDDFLFDDPSDNWIGPRTWRPGYLWRPGSTIIDLKGHLEYTEAGGYSANEPPINWNTGGTTDGQVRWQDLGPYPGLDAQPLEVITDGTTYYSPVQRTMGPFSEDITDLNQTANSLRIWDNGVPQLIGNCGSGPYNCDLRGPGGLSINGVNYIGLYLKWCAPPTGPVTTALNFYFRVRFATDDQDFEQFMQELWTIGGSGGKNGKGSLELITARPKGV